MFSIHRTTKLCGIFAVVAVAALLLSAGAQASAAHAAAANANPATYADPGGDSGSAPDITSVVVSNDTNNRISLRVNVTKLDVPSDNSVLIAVDSDRNGSTGSDGIDYLLLADLSNNTFDVLRWNGSDFVDASAATASASNDGTGVTFSINSSDLGNTSGFDFWARTLHGDTVAAGNHDDAPDSGSSTYQLGPASALKLTVQLFHASKARAGKPFVAVVTVARSDGAPADLTPENVTCAATIGGRPLRGGRGAAIGPAGSCAWRLPKGSRGKTLRATVTVNLDGATVTKTFTARIR